MRIFYLSILIKVASKKHCTKFCLRFKFREMHQKKNLWKPLIYDFPIKRPTFDFKWCSKYIFVWKFHPSLFALKLTFFSLNRSESLKIEIADTSFDFDLLFEKRFNFSFFFEESCKKYFSLNIYYKKFVNTTKFPFLLFCCPISPLNYCVFFGGLVPTMFFLTKY